MPLPGLTPPTSDPQASLAQRLADLEGQLRSQDSGTPLYKQIFGFVPSNSVGPNSGTGTGGQFTYNLDTQISSVANIYSIFFAVPFRRPPGVVLAAEYQSGITNAVNLQCKAYNKTVNGFSVYCSVGDSNTYSAPFSFVAFER